MINMILPLFIDCYLLLLLSVGYIDIHFTSPFFWYWLACKLVQRINDQTLKWLLVKILRMAKGRKKEIGAVAVFTCPCNRVIIGCRIIRVDGMPHQQRRGAIGWISGQHLVQP